MDVHVFLVIQIKLRSSQMPGKCTTFKAHSQHYGCTSLAHIWVKVGEFLCLAAMSQTSFAYQLLSLSRLCSWNGACRLALRIKSFQRSVLAFKIKGTGQA